MRKGINRRDFLKLSALTSASFLAAGCNRDPIEKLMPTLLPPYDYAPGVSIFFATTCQECSAACGMVARTREGRVIKLEGNPHHPISKGRICLQGQASLQGLYSPSRAAGPTRTIRGGGRSPVTWKQATGQLASILVGFRHRRGGILYIGPPRTGTFAKLIDAWLEQMGGGTYLPLDLTPVHSLKKANHITFGKKEIPHFALDKAEVLINFGADFLESWLNSVQMTRLYTRMHGFNDAPSPRKGKYIHISPHMSLTGTNADEWIPCPVGSEAWIALAMSRMLLARATHLSEDERQGLGRLLAPFTEHKVAENTGVDSRVLNRLVDQFGNNGRSLALAGGNCNATTNATLLQVAVNILNYVAGNIGRTVVFGADYRIGGASMAEVESAVTDMRQGRYGMVMIENVNPIFILPADLGLKEAFKTVPYLVSLSTEHDETSQLVDLHLPTSHFLETWGDARPRNGIFSLQQPAMTTVPGYDTRGIGDLLLEVAHRAGVKTLGQSTYGDYIKANWKIFHQEEAHTSLPFEQFWKLSLQRGGHYEDFIPSNVTLNDQVYNMDFSRLKGKGVDGLALIVVNSNLHNANARGANRPWLHEIPHPVTQVVWDSWVELHPDAALRLGIQHGDLVEIVTSAGRAEAPAYVYYGIEKHTVALPAGMGRELLFPNYATSRGKSRLVPVLEGKVGLKKIKVGINAMELLPSRKDHLSGDFVFAAEPVVIKPTGKKADLVTMDGQYHKDIAGIHANDRTGFGDRGQKGRGLVQVIAISPNGALQDQSSHHHLRKHFYTLSRADKRSFYDSLEKNVENAAKESGSPTPKYYKPYRWAMIIDLDRCTGCSACVAACYAENNIPVVGKDRCALGREMSWIRVERYFEHNQRTGRLETYYTPQMCQQCENAGCEPVCPVFATYHTPDGLNAMIYNRCVGTRFCANNCIFGMRRFNWRSYVFPFPLNYQLNPSVSVRVKGVMEKCTFCEHRIKEAKDLAKDQHRLISDGELQTACQQACPADAIIFGNLMDEHSEVRKRKEKTERGYVQLEEFNYQPAITYLKKVNHEGQKA